MRKLTKKKTLRICAELWEWVAKQDLSDREDRHMIKYDWPGWEKYGAMENNCPCCQYSNDDKTGIIICDICPLHNLWPNGCMGDNSVFSKYLYSKTPK